jgi:HD-like signal output (HDOD) protein
MDLLNDPGTSLSKLVEVIEMDLALATGILKLANSPLYRIGRTVESLNQAVVRLGMRECQNLIVAVGMRSLFNKTNRAQQQLQAILWDHSFLTACLCRRFNTLLGLHYKGNEFACGLIHDLGRIVLGLAAPDVFKAADSMDFQEGPELLDRELEVIGTDHCYLGAWFASLNQLPSSLTSAIQFHHTPGDAQEHQELAGLVLLADHLANHLQRGQAPQEYDLSVNPAWPWFAAKCLPTVREQIEREIPDILVQVAEEARQANCLRAA